MRYARRKKICVHCTGRAVGYEQPERMVRELDMNLTAEQVLTSFSKRVNQKEDVNNFVTVFAAAKRTGGDSISILKETVRIIGGKIETEREIQTVLAAKRLEFHVMCVIPLGMIGYMRMAFPEFLNVLYGNIPGVLLMTAPGCMVVYLFAYRLGNRIIKIDVSKYEEPGKGLCRKIILIFLGTVRNRISCIYVG